MSMLELDDLDFQAELYDVSVEDLAAYLFYVIDWACERGFLAESLNSDVEFIAGINDVRNGKTRIVDFVLDQLDGKLCSNNFKPELSDFLDVYVHSSELFNDISETVGYPKQLQQMGQIYKREEGFFSRVDKALLDFQEINGSF